jgi:hypothetical protein
MSLLYDCRAVALLKRVLGFIPSSNYMGFVAEGQVSSEYFSFHRQFLFRQLLHIHSPSYHRRYVVWKLTASLTNKQVHSSHSL